MARTYRKRGWTDRDRQSDVPSRVGREVRKADRAARRNAMQRADYDSANVRVTHSGRMSYSVNVVFY